MNKDCLPVLAAPPFPIFDSHAHYDSEQFDADREPLLSNALPQKGVVGVINMGSDLPGCLATLDLCKRFDYVYGAVGIHPECAKDLPDGWLGQVEGWLGQEKIVAVGEIGLDYHWLDACPKERQQEVFEAQLQLANRLGLPVVVHDREAHADTLDFLRRARPKGVVHCFSGSLETAREVLSLGMYIGLGGVVTFKNARHAVDVAREIPLERLLLETDAPYMAPVPFRGMRNDSSLIRYVIQRVAEIRGVGPEAVAGAALSNTKKLFSIG